MGCVEGAWPIVWSTGCPDLRVGCPTWAGARPETFSNWPRSSIRGFVFNIFMTSSKCFSGGTIAEGPFGARIGHSGRSTMGSGGLG
jgi:hypothetical protein